MQQHNPKHLHLAKGLRGRMTSAERLLWMNLRGSISGLKFRRQVPFGNYILDFYCPAARLCIEVDGPHHEEQKAKDHARDLDLAVKGVLTIRFLATDVWTDLDRIVPEIISLAQERAEAIKHRAKPNLPES